MDESDQADLDRIGRCIQVRFALSALHTLKDFGEIGGDAYLLIYKALLRQLETHSQS